ncbi:hypothetical protein ACFLU2_01705 [Chloroflexota bacterium]
MNKTIRLISITVVSFLLAVMVVGCGGGETEKPLPAHIELVPSGVDLVGKLKVNQILDDADLSELYDTFPLEKEIGLSFSDFEEALFFGNVAQVIDDGVYFAGIIKGTFDKDKLLDAIERSMQETLDTVPYKDHEIYFKNDAFVHRGTEEEFVISFLNDEVFVIGTMQPVRDVIDVRNGDKSALSGKVLDMHNELGDVLIKAALELPPQLLAEAKMAIPAEIPLNLTPILDGIEAIGLTFDTQDDVISVNLKVRYPTSDAADGAKTALKGLLMLLPMMPMEGELAVALALLEHVEISSSSYWLTISLEMTTAEIEALIFVMDIVQ